MYIPNTFADILCEKILLHVRPGLEICTGIWIVHHTLNTLGNVFGNSIKGSIGYFRILKLKNEILYVHCVE